MFPCFVLYSRMTKGKNMAFEVETKRAFRGWFREEVRLIFEEHYSTLCLGSCARWTRRFLAIKTRFLWEGERENESCNAHARGASQNCFSECIMVTRFKHPLSHAFGEKDLLQALKRGLGWRHPKNVLDESFSSIVFFFPHLSLRRIVLRSEKSANLWMTLALFVTLTLRKEDLTEPSWIDRINRTKLGMIPRLFTAVWVAQS